MGNTWATVETSKSPSGVAQIKVGSKAVKITFEDGSIDKKFLLEDLPDYPKALKTGTYFVALNSDRDEVLRIGPANTGKPITVRCVDMVRPEEGADPEPKEYENKKKHYTYRAFTVLLQVRDGLFRGCEIPMFMSYKFVDDGTGYAAFKGNPDNSFRLRQLQEFLGYTGVLEEPLEFEENLLPAILARIKAEKKDFQVIIKNGYVEFMLRADDFIDESELEDTPDDLDDVDGDFPPKKESVAEEDDLDNDEFVDDEDCKMEEQHVYHHNDNVPTVNVKVEKNSRGFNYSATVEGARSVEEAMGLLETAMKQLSEKYEVRVSGNVAEEGT